MPKRIFEYDPSLSPEANAYRQYRFEHIIPKKIRMMTFYQRGGQNLARMRSTLSSERVKTNQEFASTMHYAGKMAIASRLVKQVYQTVTKDWRCREVHQQLMSAATRSLYSGAAEETALQAIQDALYHLGYRTEKPKEEKQPIPQSAKQIEPKPQKHLATAPYGYITVSGMLVLPAANENNTLPSIKYSLFYSYANAPP